MAPSSAAPRSVSSTTAAGAGIRCSDSTAPSARCSDVDQPVWACAIQELLPTCPKIALLDDEPVRIEAQERDAGEFLRAAVLQPGLGRPLDGGAVAVDQRLTEPALGGDLLAEGRVDVLGGRHWLAERVRLQRRALRVQAQDLAGLVLAPAAFPHVAPARRGLPRVHQDSRTTTFTR